MAARRRDGVDDHQGWPEGDYQGQRGPAPDPAWDGHPSFPFPRGDYPAQMRDIGRSGGPRRESPATLHHDCPWPTAPAPTVRDPVGYGGPGHRESAAGPGPGAPDQAQRWSAQRAQTTDRSHYEVAFGDGQFEAVLTEDLAGGRAGMRGFGARTGETPPFAGAGTAEFVDDPMQREAEALWAADSGRLAQRILSNADRQAVQIRQDASAEAAATVAAAEREAAELRAAVMRMAAELSTVAAYVTESLGSHAKAPASAEALLGEYTENLASSVMPAPWPDDLVMEESPSLQTEARPPTVPAARPAERPAGRPGARPATKPAERPAGSPATKPAERPAGRSGARSARRSAAGRGRQVAAMRFAAIGTSALFLAAVFAGVAEIHLHGFAFFIFRPTGTGETGRNGLEENQGPGQPGAPRPTPSHIKVQPSPHSTVAVQNG